MFNIQNAINNHEDLCFNQLPSLVYYEIWSFSSIAVLPFSTSITTVHLSSVKSSKTCHEYGWWYIGMATEQFVGDVLTKWIE